VSVQLASSPSFSLPGVASPPVDAVTPCHASFSLSQDELSASTLSFGNASSHRLPSRDEIEALNLHHRHRPSSPDRPTLNLHWYKNVISTLATLYITHPRFYFTSSLVRVPRHWSSTCHRRSLSSSFHTHHLSAQ
jgi:hypothetical protein